MALKISALQQPGKHVSLVFFVFEGDDLALHPLAHFLDRDEQEYLRKVQKGFDLKEKELKVLFMPDTGRKVFVVVLGKKTEFSSAKAGLATRIAVQAARKEKAKKFAFWVSPTGGARETRDFYEVVASNAVMANFEFIKYKTFSNGAPDFVEEIQAVSRVSDNNIDEGLRRGVMVGEEVNACRELSNTPGADMTPRLLALHAEKVLKPLGVKVVALDKKKMESLNMGGVLGVASGSDEPPRFIVMEYMKGAKTEHPVVLVGKGVTFDTGGLNLKPSQHIYEMHMDMSGGAAVIHAIRAAARLKLKKNIVGLIPAVENMPSGSSYRPGDVLKTMSGKTIEVMDTDAEGRVILADALEYAKKYDPSLVVDVATLTGAAVVALGQRYSALFTADKKLEDTFRRVGEETGDPVWPLPLMADYEEEIKGTFGDWANIGKSRYGGAITAAVFLWQFTKDSSGKSYPWVHLDIAPRMTAIEGEFLAKGAAGAPVRLLARILEEM